jgi:nucleotide-binding universal stress UspA family protein
MKILLAVDGSDNSYEAVRALKHFARAEELILLHALDVPKPTYPRMVPEVARELYVEYEKVMKEEGERLLERMRSLLPMDSGPVDTRLVVGSPSDVIVATAESVQADLVLMGARGLGPVRERLFGSVSHRVLTEAPCAKLIINGPVKFFRQILLPLQGSADADAAIRFLSLQPFRNPAELTLLTVLPPTRAPWPVDRVAAEQLESRALQSAQDFIDDVVSRVQALGYQAKGTAVLGSPSITILERADKLQTDIIVMGSRGRSGVTRFVLGSVSHAVLHQALYPVLVFQ